MRSRVASRPPYHDFLLRGNAITARVRQTVEKPGEEDEAGDAAQDDADYGAGAGPIVPVVGGYYALDDVARGQRSCDCVVVGGIRRVGVGLGVWVADGEASGVECACGIGDGEGGHGAGGWPEGCQHSGGDRDFERLQQREKQLHNATRAVDASPGVPALGAGGAVCKHR